MSWTPLGVDPAKHQALVDGVPSWMRASLRAWYVSEFPVYDSRGSRSTYGVKRLQRFDLATRQTPIADGLIPNGPAAHFNSLTEMQILQLLDWVIADTNLRAHPGKAEEIERILRDGGSKWRVGARNGVPGLEERVPQGVQDAADAAMSAPGDAGRLLSEAWHATYGVNPQPDLGYRKAIEAVEAAVLPLVTKNDSTATLGKAIGQMRAQGDWKLPFVKEHSQNPSQNVVLGMMQALWSGHSDRHPGTPTYVLSSPEAAEAAVSIAVTLVNLFSNGGIARRP